jgi:hypothetical protein
MEQEVTVVGREFHFMLVLKGCDRVGRRGLVQLVLVGSGTE